MVKKYINSSENLPDRVYPSREGLLQLSWISANTGLKFNPLFWFAYICTCVYFKPFENKASIDPGMNYGKLYSCF